MKLIEKKCPNCGASLEFSETDKSCKCSYCHRAFEIERDENNIDEYKLEAMKASNAAFVPMLIVFFVIFAIAGGIIFGVIGGLFSHNQNNFFFNSNTVNSKTENSNPYIENISDLTNSDFEDIDNDAVFKISSQAEGINDNTHSYSIDGKRKREKIYVAFKEGTNKIISIYKVNYYDFFHPEDRYTIYVPMIYENIKKNDFDKFKNPTVSAPEYYFGTDKKAYSYGYSSLDEAYNAIVKPLEDDYKISEK